MLVVGGAILGCTLGISMDCGRPTCEKFGLQPHSQGFEYASGTVLGSAKKNNKNMSNKLLSLFKVIRYLTFFYHKFDHSFYSNKIM